MNNNYIEAEEVNKYFKFREEFTKWWKPQFGDIFLKDLEEETCYDVVYCVHENNFTALGTNCKYNKNDVIPVPQIHQLIAFIEDKTKCILEWEYEGEEVKEMRKPGYVIYLRKGKSENYIYPYDYFNVSDNRLQTLFQVACKIVGDEHDLD